MASLIERIGLLSTRLGNYIRDSILPRLEPPGGTTGQVLRKNSATDYDTGWAMVSGYRGMYELTADVTNNNAVANTLQDSGLQFSVVAGTRYRFFAVIPYTSSATTNGSRFVLDGPASPTLLNYNVVWTSSATAANTAYASAYNTPSAASSSSITTGNVAVITGVIIPSANGTVKIRFAAEVANASITLKAGATLEVW